MLSRGQVDSILDLIQKFETHRKALNDWLECFMSAIWPSQHTPFFEWTSDALSVIRIIDPDLYSELDYYIYDCDDPMKCESREWKEFILHNKNRETFKQRLLHLSLITE